VCAVRSPAHAAIAVCGSHAIAGVVRTDLRAAVAALEGRPPEDGPAPAIAREGRRPGGDSAPATASAGSADATPEPALTDAAEALISAVQRASEG
jgi:hypothetical protein